MWNITFVDQFGHASFLKFDSLYHLLASCQKQGLFYSNEKTPQNVYKNIL